jgi:putative serine protease PepD
MTDSESTPQTPQPEGPGQAPKPPTAEQPVTPPTAAPSWYPSYYGTGPAYPQSTPASHQPEPVYVAAAPVAKPTRARSTVVAAVIAGVLAGGGAGAAVVAATDNNSSTNAVSTSTLPASVSAKLDGTVSAAADKIIPSVVTISVTGSQESGIGSGVVIKSGGYILTNDHVVSVAANGGSIKVESFDGRTASATVVGRDSSDDLAVIKTNLTGLKVATFASSSSLQVGQTVVAVGAPLGLSDTVTSGIVSSLARTVRSGDNDQAVFAAVQTDAAINPGNSGGPLVDLNGNVVGINAAIASTSNPGVTIPGQESQSGSIGIGFAIPSNEASRVANGLIANRTATHASLGVTVQDNANSANGARIVSVKSGSAAAKAGLKAGDVVTGVDSFRVQTGDDLIALVRSHAPGDKINVHYTRGGKTASTTVTLGSAS